MCHLKKMENTQTKQTHTEKQQKGFNSINEVLNLKEGMNCPLCDIGKLYNFIGKCFKCSYCRRVWGKFKFKEGLK